MAEASQEASQSAVVEAVCQWATSCVFQLEWRGPVAKASLAAAIGGDEWQGRVWRLRSRRRVRWRRAVVRSSDGGEWPRRVCGGCGRGGSGCRRRVWRLRSRRRVKRWRAVSCGCIRRRRRVARASVAAAVDAVCRAAASCGQVKRRMRAAKVSLAAAVEAACQAAASGGRVRRRFSLSSVVVFRFGVDLVRAVSPFPVPGPRGGAEQPSVAPLAVAPSGAPIKVVSIKVVSIKVVSIKVVTIEVASIEVARAQSGCRAPTGHIKASCGHRRHTAAGCCLIVVSIRSAEIHFVCAVGCISLFFHQSESCGP